VSAMRREVTDPSVGLDRRRASSGSKPVLGGLAHLETRWEYDTPFGTAFAGVASSTEAARRDDVAWVAGPGLPESWLPLGPFETVMGGRWAKRSRLHDGADGMVGTTRLAVHQSRRDGWSLSRNRRSIRVVLGSDQLRLRAYGDSKAYLLRGDRRLAKLRIVGGTSMSRPPVDVLGTPLVTLCSDSTAEICSLALVINECELQVEACHPVGQALNSGF